MKEKIYTVAGTVAIVIGIVAVITFSLSLL
jgi:hypothetical protein